MDTVNRFSGPVVSDVDYADVKPNQLSFPSLNIRIYNKAGQGFIATNVPGNKYDESSSVGFKLSEGYVGVGGAEHNGIAYILSWNEEDQTGEIGVFPSPKQVSYDEFGIVSLNTSLSGFERTYKALSNFTGAGGSRRILRSTQLDFNLYSQDVIIKPSYDDSVDLYICNGRTPNIVINSGFDSDGIITERRIEEDQFNSTVRQILSVNKMVTMELNDIRDNGIFTPGNYFVYVKFLDENYNSTKFFTSIGPICINAGNDMYDSEGLQERDFLQDLTNYTDKSIQLKIDPASIDDTYTYMKFYVIRYSAYQENGIATTDIYGINKEFLIESVIGDNGLVEITGAEDTIVATYDEILAVSSIYNISNAHDIINKRYLGVNWKSEVNFTKEKSDAFAAFAQLIDTSFNCTSTIGDYDFALGNWSPFGYKVPERVTTNLGYFDGEIYPFAIRFVFKGGAETDPYPIKSKDLLEGVVPSAETLKKGLIRFPNEKQVIGSGAPDQFDQSYILKAYFDIASAMAYANGNSLFDEVLGFYFVRGEKLDNLVAQGVMFNVYDKISGTQGTLYFDGGDGGEPGDAKMIPMPRKTFPYANRFLDGSTVKRTYFSQTTEYSPVKRTDHFAVYSSDAFFSNLKVQEGIDHYMKVIYTISDTQDYFKSSGYSPLLYFSVQKKSHTYANYPNSYRVKAFNIGQGISNSASGFVTALLDGETNTNDKKGFSTKADAADETYTYNRSVFSPKYIGIKLEDGATIDLPDGNYAIVNIYKQENDSDLFESKAQSFDPTVTSYSRISQALEMTTALDDLILSGGDNFKQRVYFRQMRYFGFDGDADHISDNNVNYKHGCLFGFMMSSKLNSAMRNTVDYKDSSDTTRTYRYYPEILQDGEGADQWVLDSENEEDAVEAFQINDGYNITLNPRVALGVDSNKNILDPFKKNRGYYTNPLISGSITDQFREFSSSNYRDFLVEDSPILRVIEYKGRVICITRNKIFQVYVDDRLVQSNASGDNVIANASTFLSENVNILADYGCQHKTAVVLTDNAIYGWDYIRNIIWRIILKTSQTPGRYFLQAEDLTMTKFYQKEVIDAKDSSQFTDIVSEPDDDVLGGDGIVLGYNKKYEEVYFTLLRREGGVRYDRTFIYSEVIDGFVPERSVNTPFYLKLGDGLYTEKPEVDRGVLSGTRYFYKEDEGERQTFYDEIKAAKLSFIVNGNSDQQNTSMIVKILESLRIEMPNIKLTSIRYETAYQVSVYDFDTTDIADMPEYFKHDWLVPVSVQTSSDEEQYETDSEIEGKWVKVTLIYEPESSAEEIYIKKVISSFTPIL